MEPVSDHTESEDMPNQPEEVVLAVNMDTPPSTRRTMKLLAHIGKTQVLVLVDSGSVGTFVSQALVAKLKLPTLTCNQVQYKAADGGPMTCTQYVSDLQWYTQKLSFSSKAQVLPVQCFDMILGEDWLEEVSPMWVDWRSKVMRFTYRGKRIELKGIADDTSQCAEISPLKL